MTVPLLPAARQPVLDVHWMPRSLSVTPDACEVQDTPWFVVRRTVPDRPTAKHLLVVGQLTALRFVAVPLACTCQPVADLATVVPAAPTATHVVAAAQLTPSKACVVPDDSLLQVVPPLVVDRIFPLGPTA